MATTASPFQSSADSFVKVPTAIASAKSAAMLELEDIPFGAAESEPSDSTAKTTSGRRESWWKRMTAARSSRAQREVVLQQELTALRENYADLLKTTTELRQQFEKEQEGHLTTQRALSPFPAAVAGIERLNDRQAQAGEVLGRIDKNLLETADRDAEVMTSLGFISSEVGTLQKGIGKVDDQLGGIATRQESAASSLSDFKQRMDGHFEEVKSSSEARLKKQEQSSDDMLEALRKVEANSQRGLWIFASLLAAVVIALLFFAAQLGKVAAVEPEPAAKDAPAASESIITAPESDQAAETALILENDDLLF